MSHSLKKISVTLHIFAAKHIYAIFLLFEKMVLFVTSAHVLEQSAGVPERRSSSMTPAGVAGTREVKSLQNRPMFKTWKPSTSELIQKRIDYVSKTKETKHENT